MNEEHHLLEGYMLVQDSNKKWKTRWFVLSEDKLDCCHKKNKSVTISSLMLRGCSVICPVPKDTDLNLQGLLKLYLPDGEELFLQAGGPEDRDRWAHALGAVIRCLSTSQEVIHNKMAFQDFRTQANVSEIIGALQDPDAGVEATNHLRGGIVFKNCFTGTDIVDWLLRWSLVRNRGNAASMGQALLKLGHLQEVDLRDGTSGFSPNFSDSNKLYRFTSINLGAKRNSYYDSGDSDSSSSDDDDDDCDTLEQQVKKGKALKEGFLAKKRRLYKGWKVLKVIVRDNPPTLEYFRAKYAAATDDKFPCKFIRLNKCKVMEVIKPPSKIAGSSSSAGAAEASKLFEGPPRFRLIVRREKGRAFSFQMKDELEKVEWLSVLSEVCGRSVAEEPSASVASTNGKDKATNNVAATSTSKGGDQ
ncbi:pleckstrin [Plakobranchus ocellatus]|uniref:Pleckstrin n=1 Tax=Plakobranchus ocellatus TaxID=259542 RepID=A0AAV4A5Y6_9GAST|nr:pleckstrin [Plakobranchus ocellatus]